MGLEFGNLPIRIRKVVHHTLSSSDQRFWAKSVAHGLPNLFKRTVRMVLPLIPALILGVWCVEWSQKEYKRLQRKDPKLYENDT